MEGANPFDRDDEKIEEVIKILKSLGLSAEQVNNFSIRRVENFEGPQEIGGKNKIDIGEETNDSEIFFDKIEYEDSTEYVFEMNGFKENDIEVSKNGSTIKIEAERDISDITTDKVSEEFTVDEEKDIELVEVNNGILRVVIN